MSLRTVFATVGVAVSLMSAGALAAQAAPRPAPSGATAWVSMGTHPSYASCVATGTHLVNIWLILDFRCDTYPPYTLYGLK
ncbi:hypothetical protein ABT354_23070 [Streptomyces sp. NPDC000594]|uniref:hypothetical protein n=1 Tax=Streptomyces sp. NPDC000594 TaxID=3154261 RepID=UPI0033188571